MQEDNPLKNLAEKHGLEIISSNSSAIPSAFYREALVYRKFYQSTTVCGFCGTTPLVFCNKWCPPESYTIFTISKSNYHPGFLEKKPEYAPFQGETHSIQLISHDGQTYVEFDVDYRLFEETDRFNFTIHIHSRDPEELLRLQKIQAELSYEDETSEGEIYSLVVVNKELETRRLSFFADEIQRENYHPEAVAQIDEVIKQLNEPDPFGRLVIISGPPGVGKSYMLRGMIAELENSLNIIVPAKMASAIDDPELLTLLLGFRGNQDSNECITFFIEDADACLAPRMTDNISIVSSLLNLTDGLFGSALNLRIIATTNAEKPDFDKAMTRPGRLLKHIEINRLEPDQASKIYKRLKGEEKEFAEPSTLAEVYAEALGAKHKQKEKTPLGFGH